MKKNKFPKWLCKIFFIGLIFTFTGCLTKDIKVVDENGNPVKEALVVSEQHRYIFQPWKLFAYMTDESGKARVVTNSGEIFAKGYYPVIHSSVLAQNMYYRLTTPFTKNTIKIYKIKSPNSPSVTVQNYFMEGEENKTLYNISLPLCKQISLSYNTKSSEFIVKSKNKNLVQSKRFYFEGGDKSKKYRELKGTDALSFYCQEGTVVNKIGISTSVKGWHYGIPHHILVFKNAKNIKYNSYLEPAIKCTTEKSFYLPPIDSEHPALSSSKNLLPKLKSFNQKIPCGNQYTQELLDFIKASN